MKNDRGNILKDRSFLFAVRIVNLAKYLQQDKKEYVLSKQVLRSGTSVGALIREAEFAQSKKDFISKMSISLKEANETQYWLELLEETNYITNEMFSSIYTEVKEITALLVSTVKTSKLSEKRKMKSEK